MLRSIQGFGQSFILLIFALLFSEKNTKFGMDKLNPKTMKSLQKSFFRIFNFFLSGLFVLLGFSCDVTKYSPDEYGAPRATFKANGTILSAETDEPVDNITVVMESKDRYVNDSTATDASGVFEVADNSGFPEDSEYVLHVRDLDGDAKGAFENLDTTIVFNKEELQGGDGDWYYGEAAKELNIKLTPKK